MSASRDVTPLRVNGKILTHDVDRVHAFNNYISLCVYRSKYDIKITPQTADIPT